MRYISELIIILIFFQLIGCSTSADFSGEQIVPKCVEATYNTLDLAGFYNLKPRHLNDFVDWSNAGLNDDFHKFLRNIRKRIPNDGNPLDKNFQLEVISIFNEEIKKFMPSKCILPVEFFEDQFSPAAFRLLPDEYDKFSNKHEKYSTILFVAIISGQMITEE